MQQSQQATAEPMQHAQGRRDLKPLPLIMKSNPEVAEHFGSPSDRKAGFSTAKENVVLEPLDGNVPIIKDARLSSAKNRSSGKEVGLGLLDSQQHDGEKLLGGTPSVASGL